jgi:protocatechuate 3,4-dioxygenase beta subunit
MERIEFIKKGLSSLGLLVAFPIITACDKKNEDFAGPSDTPSNGSTNGSSPSDCEVTNSETAGPFPNRNSAALVKSNIIVDRPGVGLSIKITIKNKNNNCSALANTIVDIWHCDAQGEYSEYGGRTAVSWLRGRQITDSSGLVTFSSIFPGWYPRRAPHIHVHIYNASGRSLLITQIAFDTAVCDKVYTTASAYTNRGKQDTSNARDNVFRNGFDNQLATFTGSVEEGYVLTHTIVVSG